jgi:polysaccharide biosynthesis protein VpsM
MSRIWFVFLLVAVMSVFLNAGITHSSEPALLSSFEKNPTKNIVSEKKSGELRQMGAFKIKKNAHKFIVKLRDEGYDTVLKEGFSAKNEKIYRVFVRDYEYSQPSEPASIEPLHYAYQDVPDHLEDLSSQAKSSTGSPGSSDISPIPYTDEPLASYKIFKALADAEEYAGDLKEKGYDVAVLSENSNDNAVIHTVFGERAAPAGEDSYQALPVVSSLENARYSAGDTKPLMNYAPGGKGLTSRTDTAETIQASPSGRLFASVEKSALYSQKKQMDIASVGNAQQASPAVTPPSVETPGVATQRTSEEVFGRRSGFIHPFLAVTGYYNDNVFYSRRSKKSDFVTILSPGVWLTVPHVNEKLLNVETSNVTPGGFRLRDYEPETFRRYQIYLLYNADIDFFSRYSSENTVNHKLEGLFQYNLRGGLSLAFLDQFLIAHDDRGSGISTKVDKYISNLAHFTASYEPFERFKFKADYTNFLVDYDASRNDFRDRVDNGIALYAFYKLKPKTSVFVEYDYVNVDYDKHISGLDSREHHYFGGLQWDVTAKTKGTVKAGYGVKDFVTSDFGDENYFTMEANIDYKLTSKTTLILKAARETNETDISASDYILTNRIELEYLQRLTGKITAHIRLAYEDDDYRGGFLIDDEKERLRNRYYRGGFALQYKLKEWLETNIGYLYTRRNSNINDFDYTSNIAFFRITGSL